VLVVDEQLAPLAQKLNAAIDKLSKGKIQLDSFPFIDAEHGGSVEGCIRDQEESLKTLPQGAKIIPGHGPLAGRGASGRHQ
jgi:hypothetical protein